MFMTLCTPEKLSYSGDEKLQIAKCKKYCSIIFGLNNVYFKLNLNVFTNNAYKIRSAV
jgi:hypothetical protein